tara:strand:+ start:173 stop:976 length:804 start_codon:yes stop_codon:yes gene_type:complete
MNKALIIVVLLSLSLVSSAFSQTTETITLTTYYPSPIGIYNQLVTNTLGVGDNVGSDGINSADAPDPATNPGDVWIAGNVGIGTTTPHGPLEIDSTTSGFIPPRMTTTQRDNIDAGSLIDGMMLYNTTTGQLEIYSTSGGWQPVGRSAYVHLGTKIFSTAAGDGLAPTSFTDMDLSSMVLNNPTIVVIKVDTQQNDVLRTLHFRTNGETKQIGFGGAVATHSGAGISGLQTSDSIGYIMVETDASGIIEWRSWFAGTKAEITLLGYF